MKPSTHMIYLDGFSSWPIRPEARDALIEALSLPGGIAKLFGPAELAIRCA